MKTPALDFSKIRIDPAQARRIPRALALRGFLLPLAEIDGTLHVAVLSQPDETTSQQIRQRAQCAAVAFHLADPVSLRRELLRVYGSATDATTARAGNAEDAVGTVDEILRAARLRHASDVHVDPGRNGVSIRFRVDGVLEPYRQLPSDQLAPVVSRIKVLAGMDIAERRAPQDGGFSLPAFPEDPSSASDVRVATLPVRHGERVTLRLLTADREQLTLERLGMRAEHLAAVERLLAAPHGLLLLTGPTGSGKSTTLYAAIRRLLQHGGLNILTVEDPIEYEIDGVSQAEVDSADKVSFSKALRSLLRHDPDVIMIGEIRDADSMDIAVKAALTGHLVLSTLHTNSAIGAVVRLTDMGLAPHLVAATLRMSIAQRLVRRLCPHCRRPTTISPLEAELLRQPEAAGRGAFLPGGCLSCAGKGFRGRTALFEIFTPDQETEALIARGVDEQTLRDHLAGKGYQTLYHDAFLKILDGMVTASDVCRGM